MASLPAEPMNDKDFLKALIAKGSRANEGYFQYAHIAATLLDKRLHEQLHQLINGPIYDGNVLSKALREELFELGLAIRVCHKGEQGYTGATYFAYSVMKIILQIRTGEVSA